MPVLNAITLRLLNLNKSMVDMLLSYLITVTLESYVRVICGLEFLVAIEFIHYRVLFRFFVIRNLGDSTK